MSNTKENFIIYDIFNNIKYQSKDYDNFNGNNLNDFIKYCINSKFDLSCTNLKNANLENANLSYANLSYANLYNANLSYANLYNANLENANLYNANLSYADLRNTDLSYANLSYANLSYANLKNANLSYADLRNTDLKNTNLYNANLENANLYYANTINAKMPVYCKWDILYKINENKEVVVIIGCKEKTIKEWNYFFSKKCKTEYNTKRDTIEFKQIHAMYESYKTYLKKMELI